MHILLNCINLPNKKATQRKALLIMIMQNFSCKFPVHVAIHTVM